MERLSFEDMQNIDFWRSLCPQLTVTEESPLALDQTSWVTDWRSDDWAQCKELINEDGYFAYDSFFKPRLIDRLADCVTQLDEKGILPSFCFMYDEFWELLPALDPFVSELQGEYLLLPAVWAWRVQTENQTAFTPHRDQVRDVGVDDEEHLDYLTFWIPLNDLNHASSNICLLPASCDPDYDEGTDQVVVENLQDIRCLQGNKGSVFCWATGLVHWGTRQSRFAPPRMSVGYYVQNASAEIFDGPPLDFSEPLPLVKRLNIIGQQILNYSRDDSHELLKLAHSLVQLEPVG